MSVRALALLALLSGCGDNNFHGADAAGPGTPDAPTVADAAVSIDASLDAAVTADAPGFQLACTLMDLEPVFTCVANNCAQDLSISCFITSCALTLLTLPPDCRTCLLTAISSQDIATTLPACGLTLPGM